MKRLILIAVLLIPGGALAGTGQGDAKKNTQMVCKNIAETGSRLSKRRICMTRLEWAEHKRIQRSDLERAQANRNEPGSN